MALTPDEFNEAVLRVSPPAPMQARILARIQNTAHAIVTTYAPSAPTDVADEAIILIGGYLFDQPTLGTFGRRGNAALRHSGAAALLAPWRSHSGVIAGDDTVEESDIEPPTPPTPTPAAFALMVGWSAAGGHPTLMEVAAAARTSGDSVVIPAIATNEYLWIFRSNAAGGDPSVVQFGPAAGWRNYFGAAEALTIEGVAGQFIIGGNTLNGPLASGTTLRVT